MGWREEVELISWEMKRWIIIAMAAKAVVFCPLRSVKKKKGHLNVCSVTIRESRKDKRERTKAIGMNNVSLRNQ